MNLKLKNPLVFLDLETTGMNIVTDRIVEIALIKVHPDGKEEEKLYRINPEMHIPEASSKIHGIYDEDVKDKPTFKEVAKTIAQFVSPLSMSLSHLGTIGTFFPARISFIISSVSSCRQNRLRM